MALHEQGILLKGRCKTLLTILRVLLSIIVVAIAGYGLMTQNFEFQAYMFLFLGLVMLVSGIQEFQKDKKLMGWLLIAVFAFLQFVFIQSFI